MSLPPGTHRLQVPEGEPQRLDRVLAAGLPGLSRKRVAEFLDTGRLRVEGFSPRKGLLVPGGTELQVRFDAPADDSELEAQPELAVPILYEDDALIALDKPPGLPSTAANSEDRDTLANFLAARIPGGDGVGDSPLEWGLVHRLDTPTSGAILAAKTRHDWIHLRNAFRAGEVRKRYWALVDGTLEDSLDLREAIASDRKRPKRVRALPEGSAARGARDARTRITPLASAMGWTLVEAELLTRGARHQIRAHLAQAGHPISNDPIYAPRDTPIASPRLFLHAASIELELPLTGAPLHIHSPLPNDLRAALRDLSIPIPNHPRS